jgi:hypothetical protein
MMMRIIMMMRITGKRYEAERKNLYVSYLQSILEVETRGKQRLSIVVFFLNVGIISIDKGTIFPAVSTSVGWWIRN